MKVLAVVAPHVGGIPIAQMVAGALGSDFETTVADSVGKDREALSQAEVVFTALAPVTAEHIQAAPALRLIQVSSHGFDHVDVAAAAARGIAVCNIGSTDAEAQDVAEHSMALLLALAKQLIDSHNALRQSDWALPRLQSRITELYGKTLGVVGMGKIGRLLARRAKAFDMRLVYSSPSPIPEGIASELRMERLELDELLRRSDYVSLHVPLAAETHHLIDARRLALMKPTAFIVNTSRGSLIDEAALADALTAGRLAGAGLDVFDPEPPPPDHPLLLAPNVVLTPHSGGVTRESMLRIGMAAVANVQRFAQGEAPSDTVTV